MQNGSALTASRPIQSGDELANKTRRRRPQMNEKLLIVRHVSMSTCRLAPLHYLAPSLARQPLMCSMSETRAQRFSLTYSSHSDWIALCSYGKHYATNGTLPWIDWQPTVTANSWVIVNRVLDENWSRDNYTKVSSVNHYTTSSKCTWHSLIIKRPTADYCTPWTEWGVSLLHKSVMWATILPTVE